MKKKAIAKGATVEEAFANACRELGVDTTEAECEILEMPTKKTFGLFGGRPAKVQASIETPDPVEAPQPAAPAAQPAAPVQDAAKAPAPKKAKAPGGADPAETAAAYLRDVLAHMGLAEVSVEINRTDAGADLRLAGEDIGFIIGHRGETLDALQYLASLVANHVEESYYRVTLDVGSYREKRKDTLEALGRRMALRAVRSGRNTALEPMNPYERRIIHTAVQTVEGAKSWSEGQDLGRHVVIGPEGGERPSRGGRYGRDDRRPPRRDNRRGGGAPRDRGPRPDSAPRPEGPKSDAPELPIYGKIEAKKPDQEPDAE